MIRKLLMVLGFSLLSFTSLNAADEKEASGEKTIPKEKIQENVSITHNTVTIDGVPIAYKALTGNMILKNSLGKEKASIFYVAYLRDFGEEENTSKTRPITFCFNGGPGSSAIWLHVGAFGPKKVAIEDLTFTDPPYTWEDNPHSLLDITDLVFIDPVSTGYSRALPEEDLKQFHGVEGDVRWMAEFIRQFTTRYNRWGSPKFLAGESYGTTRAASLASYLFSEHNLYVNGVALISSILNFQTIHDSNNGNDLPYILYLPSMAATAWYHHKIAKGLQQGDLLSTLAKAEQFAFNEYATALLYGDILEPKARQEIVVKLSEFTGLHPSYIERANLRIDPLRFAKELLRDQRRTVGRFDSRYKGFDANPLSNSLEYDPSADAIFGPFTAIFNEYVRNELKWNKEEEYVIIADVQPWNYGKATNQYLNVSGNLKSVMSKNPAMKIFVGSGLFDLATPYFGTDYTFNHLGIDPLLKKQISINYYEAGHMMYLHKPSLEKLKKDLKEWYQGAKKSEVSL